MLRTSIMTRSTDPSLGKRLAFYLNVPGQAMSVAVTEVLIDWSANVDTIGPQ